jgi:hypothetical protein
MGENLEKQRESQLPIAQMRAQLAASKIAMGQKSTAAKEFADWQETGKPMSEKLYSRLVALSPGSSTAEAAKSQYEAQQKQRGLESSDLGNAINKVTLARSMGKEPNPSDLALVLGQSSSMQPLAGGMPPSAGGTPVVSGAPSPTPSTKSIVTLDGRPVDPGTELEAIGALLPTLTGKDKEEALKLIAKLQSAIPEAEIKQPVNRTGGDTGLTDVQNIERRLAVTKEREAPYEAQLTDWAHNAVNLPVQQTRIDTMTDLLHGVKHTTDAKGKNVSSVDPKLSLEGAFKSLQQQGAMGAFLNTVKEGVQAHTPWGTIALSAPVVTAMKSLNLSPEQQQRFGQFTMELARDNLEQSNLKQFGAHPNQAEFAASQATTPQPIDPSVNLEAYLAARHANIGYQRKAHRAYSNWRENNPPEALASRFFNTKEYRELEDAREKALINASRKAMQ